jgi:cbb3-type cytochrome oxidase subunit 3
MPRNVLTHFPFLDLVVAGQLIFFAVFVGALIWIFRRGSKRFYDGLAALPLEDGGEHERN